uniref:hypothetical protein n=1 Tax=uncultured Halomonas sp. TaxID=173971 RepID=UPI002605FBDA
YLRDGPELSYIAEADDTYYLEASSYRNTGDYTVEVSENVLTDDHSDTQDGATALTLGETMAGNIEVIDDKDFFQIDLEEGQRYLFDMVSEGIEELDGELNFYRSNGDYLARLESGYLRDGPELSYIAEADDTYYLEASSYRNTGDYTVEVLEVGINNAETEMLM